MCNLTKITKITTTVKLVWHGYYAACCDHLITTYFLTCIYGALYENRKKGFLFYKVNTIKIHFYMQGENKLNWRKKSRNSFKLNSFSELLANTTETCSSSWAIA